MSTEWMTRAQCRGADTEEFFATDQGGRPGDNGYRPALPAVAVYCRPCQVKASCLEWALTTDQRHGVLGGLTAEQRAGLKKRARRQALAAERNAS